jgi:NAD(P)-dependent dehydrogenase (short-subunit alcohol dehydrogenase family)
MSKLDVGPKGTIVVTGVSSGIGLATAKRLVRSGFRVFGSVRKQQDSDRTAKELGPLFTPLMFDLRDEDSIRTAAGVVSTELDRTKLMGLVNNAGSGVPGPLLYQKIADFRRQFEINVFGQLAVIQAFAPLLGADVSRVGKPGRIVMLSSVVGKYTLPLMAAYGSSKHAIEGMSEALRRELMLFGIDVVIIAPGMVNSSFVDNLRKEDVTPYLNTPYRASLMKFGAMMANKKALSPERVAESIHHALTTRKPRVRYTVAPNYLRDWILPTRLPKRLIDHHIAKRLGLGYRTD